MDVSVFFLKGRTTMQNYVGILYPDGKNGLVLLDRFVPGVGKSLRIPAREMGGAPLGMKVVCHLLNPIPDLQPGQPLPETPTEPLQAAIVEVLGDPGRSDVAIQGIIRAYGLPEQFPESLLAAAEGFASDPDPADIEKELRRGRLDLRGQHLITIDGEDAKDLDDAISLVKQESGVYLLGVHIADVCHYVKENSSIDQEARKRGTSVYLVDRVLPMLPPRLSNGICSLNPNRDRLALSVFLSIDQNGVVTNGRITESVICSAARTSYREVYLALTEGVVQEGRYQGFLDDLRLMRELAEVLQARRRQLGSIGFEFPETRVDLDQDGKPTSIYPYPKSFTNDIIEAFMVAANEYVAETCHELGLPFIYRVHDQPDAEKLGQFLKIAANFGLWSGKHSKVTPRDLAALQEKAAQHPSGGLLSYLLLRSMAKAEYLPENIGHYGLALTNYCHFTSPIRRYPDLFIHRVIKGHLHQAVKTKRWSEDAGPVAEWCSKTERTAMQAERDTVSQKSVEYMAGYLGQIFAGRISGFNQSGIYVQLENTIEGFIPYRTMDEYIEYDGEQIMAVGTSSDERYYPGDEVRVQVARADVILRQIDFELVSHKSEHQQGRTRGKSPASARGSGRRTTQGAGSRRSDGAMKAGGTKKASGTRKASGTKKANNAKKAGGTMKRGNRK